MARSRWHRLIAALALAALALPAAPGPMGWQALGHAQLVVSSPGAGELVPDPPAEIVLVFSEPLEAGFSGVDLAESSGEELLRGAGAPDPSDPYQLVVELPPLDDGVYTVTWRSLSAADGHTASGFFSFGVGEADAPISAGGTIHASDQETDPLAVLARWLGYLGLLAGLGVPIVAAVVLRRRLRTGPVRALGLLLLLSAAATLGALIWSALRIQPDDLAGYALGSRNGVLQLARGGVMGLGGGLVLALAAHRAREAMATAALAALGGIWLLVAAGHAAGEVSVGPAAALVVHVAAVAVWLSGVAVLAAVPLRARLVAGEVPAVHDLVPRFSALALASIGLVAATGVHAAWSLSGTLLDPGTDYGRILLLKLGLTAGALALGGVNYLAAGRRLGWLGGLRRRLALEAGLAAAVLLVTGALSMTPPADGVEGVQIAAVPDAFGRVVPGASLSLLPGRPGVNQVVVEAGAATGVAGGTGVELVLDRLDAGGQTRVPLRDAAADHGAMAGMDHGSAPAAEAGHLIADALVLPPGSSWDATVRILSGPDGLELSRQRYSFAMGEAGVSGGRVASLLDPGTAVAALLVVAGALSLGLGAGGTRLPRCEAAASRVALLGAGAVAVGLGVVIGLGRLAAVG